MAHRDQGRNGNADSAGFRIHPALIGALLLALVVVIFIFQNTNRITIHFLWFTRDMQVWVALLLTSAIAIGAAELFAVYLRRRRNA